MNITTKAQELREALELDESTKALLGKIELGVVAGYTLADAIREGSSVTEQATGWGDGESKACALTAAATAVKARGYAG